MHCLTKNLPQQLVQLAVMKSWLDSLLTRLVEVMVHRSLHLAIAPRLLVIIRQMAQEDRPLVIPLGGPALVVGGCGFRVRVPVGELGVGVI